MTVWSIISSNVSQRTVSEHSNFGPGAFCCRDFHCLGKATGMRSRKSSSICRIIALSKPTTDFCEVSVLREMKIPTIEQFPSGLRALKSSTRYFIIVDFPDPDFPEIQNIPLSCCNQSENLEFSNIQEQAPIWFFSTASQPYPVLFNRRQFRMTRHVSVQLGKFRDEQTVSFLVLPYNSSVN